MRTLYQKLGKRMVYAKARLNRVAYRFMAVPHPDKWVFIVGCYNSGTTLLHQLVGRHPQVGSMPLEGRRFTDELPLAKDHGLQRLWALEPERFHLDEKGGGAIDADKIKRQWAFMYNDATRPVLVEKSVINAARTRWLQQHFENSHFIVLMRNGYAVAEGIRRKAGQPIDKAILQWKNSYELLLADMDGLDHALYLTYEELVATPGAVMDRIAAFLGIEPFPDGTTQGQFNVHGARNPITDMNRQSIHTLSGPDIAIINRLAGDMLQRSGYALLPSGG